MLNQRPKLSLPGGADKLLLHSCCAPCSGEVMEAITASGIDYTIFFYNPNIHPQKEYLLRKDENIRFAEQHGVPTGSLVPRVWSMNRSAVSAAPCASTCVSNAPRYTPMRAASR